MTETKTFQDSKVLITHPNVYRRSKLQYDLSSTKATCNNNPGFRSVETETWNSLFQCSSVIILFRRWHFGELREIGDDMMQFLLHWAACCPWNGGQRTKAWLDDAVISLSPNDIPTCYMELIKISVYYLWIAKPPPKNTQHWLRELESEGWRNERVFCGCSTWFNIAQCIKEYLISENLLRFKRLTTHFILLKIYILHC